MARINNRITNRVKLDVVGQICREHRKREHVPMRYIADVLGCSVMSISQFERGYNNSASILLWYIKSFHLRYDDFFNVYEKGVLSHGLERIEN